MADHEHTAHESTSPKFWITWLRFRPIYRRLASRINGLAVAGRRKLGLEQAPARREHSRVERRVAVSRAPGSGLNAFKLRHSRSDKYVPAATPVRSRSRYTPRHPSAWR